MSPLLVIDCHYLCHRAYHTEQGRLTWEQKATGVIHGFLRTLQMLKEEFRTDRVAFCFESPWSVREKLFPAYKNGRRARNDTPEQAAGRAKLHEQISALRDAVLHDIGYRNIFQIGGLESDDIMAALAQQAEAADQETVLVTADADLYQCLSHHVTVYNPQNKRTMSLQRFKSTYGIRPDQWALVKATGGCSTDNVPGVKGIGEATALKYYRCELPPEGRWYRIISSVEGMKQREFCLQLVRLPFRKIGKLLLIEDQVTVEKWNAVCQAHGMRSLAAQSPFCSRNAITHSKKP